MNPKSIPYKPNCPASADVFVGRSDLLQIAMTGLQTAGTCYSVVGKLGVGKTSLLKAISCSLLSHSLQNSVSTIPLLIYVECSRTHHKTLPDLLQDIVQETIKALSLQQDLDCPQEILKTAQTLASQGENLYPILEAILDWSFEQKKQTLLPIFLLDDVHRLCENDWFKELLSLLHTAINHHRIALVIAGRDVLLEEFRNDVSPFWLVLTQIFELKPLEFSETQALVAKAHDWGWEIDDTFSTHIYQLTQGHPYLLHYCLYRLLITEAALTIQGLEMLKTLEYYTEIEQVLDRQVLGPERSNAQLSQEKVIEIRSNVREAQLEVALECLLNFPKYQSHADLLAFRLNSIMEQERKGTLTPAALNTERTRIAEQILKLIQ